MVATCKDPGALRLAAELRPRRWPSPPPTHPATISLPTVEFNLADFASHDEQGYHVWRFDDPADGRGAATASSRTRSARRFPEQGHKHVSINREFSNDELPHLIAFLISVYDELDEPPF